MYGQWCKQVQWLQCWSAMRLFVYLVLSSCMLYCIPLGNIEVCLHMNNFFQCINRRYEFISLLKKINDKNCHYCWPQATPASYNCYSGSSRRIMCSYFPSATHIASDGSGDEKQWLEIWAHIPWRFRIMTDYYIAFFFFYIR